MSLHKCLDLEVPTGSDRDYSPVTGPSSASTLATLSRSVDLGCGIDGGLLSVTIGDVKTALGGGFSASEVEYMFDLPRGRVAALATQKAR